MNDDEDLGWTEEAEEEEVEYEEEDAVPTQQDDDPAELETDDSAYILEPEQPKHQPREPLLPLLAAFSQVRTSTPSSSRFRG